MAGIPRLLRRLPSDVLRLRLRRTAPGKPPTGYVDVYADATGALAGVDDAGAALSIGGGGTPTSIANGGGSVAVDGSGFITATAGSGQDISLLTTGASYLNVGHLNNAELHGGPDAEAQCSLSQTGRLILQPSPGELVRMSNMPTVDAGLTDGIINDGGALRFDGTPRTRLPAKAAVRVATTANGTLATAYENGDAVDGVTLATGDRILLKDQSTGSQNGIYTVNASGAPTRATDADSAAEVFQGFTVFVKEGTTNANRVYVHTTAGAITLGSTALTFTQLGGSGGGGSVATDTIWDAAGDLAVGTGADTAAKLAMGSALQVLRVNAGATALEWAAASGGAFAGAMASHSADQSITSASFTTLAFNGEVFDTDAFHDNATNNSRLTVPTGKDGYYLVGFDGWFDTNASDVRFVRLLKNGTTELARDGKAGISGNGTPLNFTTLVSLAAADYLQVQVYQASGGALNFLSTADWSPRFWLVKVG